LISKHHKIYRFNNGLKNSAREHGRRSEPPGESVLRQQSSPEQTPAVPGVLHRKKLHPRLHRKEMRSAGVFPPNGLTSTTSPHCLSPVAVCRVSGSKLKPSGLWHQAQRRGQPLRKIVVRMPGPSCTANSLMSNSVPVMMILSFTLTIMARSIRHEPFVHMGWVSFFRRYFLSL
jgi:hypothetical protein